MIHYKSFKDNICESLNELNNLLRFNDLNEVKESYLYIYNMEIYTYDKNVLNGFIIDKVETFKFKVV